MRKIKSLWRLRLIKADAERYYEATAYHCAKVSAMNRNLAFAVYKVGIFGGPKVEQIARPDNVMLSENDGCVIIKDGFIYRLNREVK